MNASTNTDNSTNTNGFRLTDKIPDWETAEWREHRTMILASPLHRQLTKLVDDAYRLSDRMAQMAEKLLDVDPAKNPLILWGIDDSAAWAVDDLKAAARVLETMVGAIKSSL